LNRELGEESLITESGETRDSLRGIRTDDKHRQTGEGVGVLLFGTPQPQHRPKYCA